MGTFPFVNCPSCGIPNYWGSQAEFPTLATSRPLFPVPVSPVAVEIGGHAILSGSREIMLSSAEAETQDGQKGSETRGGAFDVSHTALSSLSKSLCFTDYPGCSDVGPSHAGCFPVPKLSSSPTP